MDSIADEAVVATNDDAAVCKYQAVSKGYYLDPYIDKFLSNKVKSSMPRKAPEINHGYFARSASIAYLVEKFICKHPDAQIISLGAGYDTLYWRLKDRNFLVTGDQQPPRVTYVEIDMSSVVVHKIMSIRRHPELHRALASIQYKGEGIHSESYHLISFDLRQVDKLLLYKKLFDDCQLVATRPTLCLAECVLVYMPVQDSSSLIRWFSGNFNNVTMANYEQCNMMDRFSEIMLASMNARHCDLMGVDACKSLETQMERFKKNGLDHTRGWSLLEIFKKCLLPSSIERISKIEFLDERELLEQLLEHYCIVIGSHHEIDWLPETEYWLSETTMTLDMQPTGPNR
uniref:Leucine carboxyl methyltransferase 1 n=1 Tax=Aceria tosichella TaxID=561515 RepID=A0A6G1SJM3_9ACAR